METKEKIKIIILILSIISCNTFAQTLPYMSIIQNQAMQGQSGSSPIAIVNEVSTGPIGSSREPSRLDFGFPFTVKVDVPKNAYTGKLLFLYMQDTQNGSGAVNNWYLQGTPVSVPSLQFTYSSSESSATFDRYILNVDSAAYPTLMNAMNHWNSLPDGSIIRPTFYIGYTQNASTPANWGEYVINFIDIWGYKNRLDLTYPQLSHPDVIIEVNQYDLFEKDLEQMLLTGVQQPGGTIFTLPPDTYSWYMNEEFGVNPYTYTVNNPSPWMNNIYQTGFKPWINSTHISAFNLSNLDFWAPDSHGNICYTLSYYVIPSVYIPSDNGYVPAGTFNAQAYRIIIKINPYISVMTGLPTQAKPPGISNAITIASQDYGSATAGTQWGPPIQATETNYMYAGNYLPGDGAYSVGQDILGMIQNDSRPIDWYVPAGGMYAPAKKYDHTSGNGTGFMYIVNASTEGGIFYRNTFDVCPNMNLQFSMWLSNICDGIRQNTGWNMKYRIKPNVHIQIYPGNLTTPPTSTPPLLDYYTGEIPMNGIWEQYFTPVFNVPSGVSQITVFYLSVNNGGDGNDFMIDDIRIQRSNGAFNFSETDISQCMNANDIYQITAVWDTTVIKQIYGVNPPGSFSYKWIFYDTTDPGIISGLTGRVPITSNGSPTEGNVAYPADTISIHVPGTAIGTYKLIVAASAGDLNDQCATFSYFVFSPDQPPVIDNLSQSQNTNICPGELVNLSIDINASNVPDPNKLMWFSKPIGNLTETPLLDPNGDQITGANVSVNPSRTTTYIVKQADCSTGITYTVNVGNGPAIGFGANAQENDYTRRVCYSATSLEIPITNLSQTQDLKYEIYLDGTGNAISPAAGTLLTGSSEILTLDLQAIKPSLANFRKGINSVTCSVITQETGSSGCGKVGAFTIRFISDSTVWVPALNAVTPQDNSNWNNDANWYITDKSGNRYAEAGVPMACTNVIIPGNANNYPILKTAGDYGIGDNLPTDAGFDPQPMCNSIVFEFGGEVAQIQHLEYLYAFVELNLGTYDSNRNFTNTANLINTDGGYNYYPGFLSRDRYYSMTAPLKEMYAGDFAFAGRPNAYMKYVDTLYINSFNPDIFLINKWSNSINSYNIPFPKGFGFAYQILSGKANDEMWPYSANQDYLNSIYGLIRWPYYTNSDYLSKINPRHTYLESSAYGDGISTFSYYYASNPMESTGKTDQVSRNSVIINNSVTGGIDIHVPKGNRFIVEDDNTNKIPAIVSVTPSNNRPDTEILLGNPLMSHIDFGKLYVDNKNSIGNYCRMWTGNAQYYSLLVDENGLLTANTALGPNEIEETGTFIAPMQSFLVAHKTSDPVNFNLPNISVTYADKNVNLRRSSNNEFELLKIISSNSRYSAAAVIVHYPDKEVLDPGVPKLFSPSGNIPEIYFLQDQKKEIIAINRYTHTVPLGIRTDVTGVVTTLKFYGLENFSPTVSIYDAKTGSEQPLSAIDNEFKFLNTEGNTEDRLYLLFSPTVLGMDKVTDTDIRVYAVDGSIRVISSPDDPIESVEIYTMQGQLLSIEKNLSVISMQTRQPKEKGIYPVKVKTKSNTLIRKVLIY